MPKFAVEVQYLLPVWNCVIVEAENADAAQKAVMFDESGHTWDQQVEDYESSRASTIEGWREIADEYDVEDLEAATPQGLWDFIHEAGQHEAGKALAERRYRVSMERPVNECRNVVVKAASMADASKAALTANFDESQLDDWTPCDPGAAVVYDVEPVDETEPLTPINRE
jgi:hypothetical protein